MSETDELRDILYNELSNLTIFIRLLKYTIARQKMIKCFSVTYLECLTFKNLTIHVASLNNI